MQFSVKNALRAFVAAVLVAVSAPVFAQIAPGSVDVSAHIGFNNLTGVDNDKHVQFGFAGGVNLTHEFALLGEYTFLPQGSFNVLGAKVSAHYQNIGVAGRYSFLNKKNIAPYGVAAGGFARATASASIFGTSASDSANGGYIGLGGGASFYLAPKWGLRPEVRWDRQMFHKNGSSSHVNDVRGTIAVFYQFGGR